ncbi:rRNA maturation RNase YbeY [bacterium]|nr:rRNA maturation RNase YbeY [candidate division CSSED10-310 bacterium]
MSVTVGEHCEQNGSEIDPDHLADIIESVYQELHLPSGDIEISLVNDRQITELNKKYRNRDISTNVLSFPQYEWSGPEICLIETIDPDGPPILWGEVIVSKETVKRDAKKRKVPYKEELLRICIHGMLHLFGYDHDNDDDHELMQEVERSAMRYAIQRMKQVDNDD